MLFLKEAMNARFTLLDFMRARRNQEVQRDNTVAAIALLPVEVSHA